MPKFDTSLVDSIASQSAAEEKKRGAIVSAAIKALGKAGGKKAKGDSPDTSGQAELEAGEVPTEGGAEEGFGVDAFLSRSTRGSKPFTKAELRQGYRRL